MATTIRKRLFRAIRQVIFGPMMKRAQQVKTLGLHRFEYLDRDCDRLITVEDLDKVLAEDALSAEDLATVRYMQKNISSIGHQIRIEFTHVESVVRMGDQLVPIKETIRIPVYGIERDDLRRYPLILRFGYMM